uniref:Transmembrane 9 superfamily member n=1 Tax=Odontella aurita TaxID=265563 RepID=A0A7S4JCQ3_9STRA
MSRAERKEVLKEKKNTAKKMAAKFEQMKSENADMVSNTAEAAQLRSYQLRKKKRKGFVRRKEKSLSSILFPGASPEDYTTNEAIPIMVDLVESRKTQVPYKYYDLPVCQSPDDEAVAKRFRKNLGQRLQGSRPEVAPFDLHVVQDKSCSILCMVTIGGKKLRWMRKLVERQYRVHLSLDQLPVLMRSKELNYAVRGYPVGFKAPPSYTGLKNDELYIFNHLKFTVTYREDPSQFDGVRITGFDIHPVSVEHKIDTDVVTPTTTVETCNADGASPPVNDPTTYLALRTGSSGEPLKVVYSYEVKWDKQDLAWADRWDVYLVGSPDDDIHYFAIVNSLMIVAFLMGAVATIMIRTLRKDIAGYNEMQTLEEAQEETGWKLVHGDVFRPPTFSPMALSVMCGTGIQIGCSVMLVLMCAVAGLVNPMKKGQALSSIVFLYVLSGSASGYFSSRLYKFCDGKDWKLNTIMTATAFPGLLVVMFIVLNVFLSMAGAATAVSFWLIIALFLLWVGVCTPLAFAGSYFGFKADKGDVPTKTNQIARFIPEQPFFSNFPWSCLFGGILPFGSVCIELFFIMSALWLHQYYYVMGFLLAVVLILAATCGTVSIVMCYLQLCTEDHRWWWNSFMNCAASGLYLLLYSLWFLSAKLQLVGVLPVVVYLTYMTMISLAFSLFCGAVGFYSCFWFTKMIYGAVKVD